MSSTLLYRAFGLTIASPASLWMTPTASGLPDVTVVDVTAARPAPLPQAEGPAERVDVLQVGNMGEVRVVGGHTIEVRLTAPTDPRVFRQLVGGPALGLLLHQRGSVVLHGSAASVHGRGVVVLGASGLGKSTLAAALRARGHGHISDGMSVLRVREGRAEVLPGPPFAKLWPDSVECLGEAVGPLERVLPDLSKRVIPIAGPVVAEPALVHRIYSLHVGEPMGALQLAPALGAWELVRNYYPTEYLGRESAPDILRRCVAIAGCTPTCSFGRIDDLERLDAAARGIEEDVVRG